MMQTDDELRHFAVEGVALPEGGAAGWVERDGARLWYASYGEGAPVLLLHGGLGHSGNWGLVIPALTAAGHRAIVMDTRGHGRSTRDEQPFHYETLARDAEAVLDSLGIARAVLVGWSDGACTALVMAAEHPERVAGVFFFACNVTAEGVKPFVTTPVLERCFARHREDYERLSSTPGEFLRLVEALGPMQKAEPGYNAERLAVIHVPVTVAIGEGDEFIRREHAEWMARAIPGAEFVLLEGVSHFGPLQRPDVFNAAVLEFLRRDWASRP